MVINTKSWHYRAYDFSYAMSSRFAPSQTNLCQYVRRIMFMAPLVGLAFGIFFTFVGLLSLCYLVFGPIFGWLPRNWLKPWNVIERDAMFKYQGLKLGRSYNAFQVYPWHVILLAILFSIHWEVGHHFGYGPLRIEGMIVGGIVSFIALCIGLAVYFESDTGKLINAWLKARKQNVCPIVEFQYKE